MRRKTDIYVMVISHAQCVAAKGKYIAIVSTTVETDDPKLELEPGIRLLGKLIARFDSVNYLYEPLADGAADKCYISKSYDATSYNDEGAAGSTSDNDELRRDKLLRYA